MAEIGKTGQQTANAGEGTASKLSVKFLTPMQETYYKNDRLNLQCFPVCEKFGDYKYHKKYVTDNDIVANTHSYCNEPLSIFLDGVDEIVDTSDPNSLQRIKIYGRIHQVEPPVVVSENPEVKEEKQGDNNSQRYFYPQFKTGDSYTLDNFMGSTLKEHFKYHAELSQMKPLTYNFAPKHWKYTLKPKKPRSTKLISIKYAFEVIVCTETKNPTTKIVTLKIHKTARSSSFHIATVRSLTKGAHQSSSSGFTMPQRMSTFPPNLPPIKSMNPALQPHNPMKALLPSAPEKKFTQDTKRQRVDYSHLSLDEIDQSIEESKNKILDLSHQRSIVIASAAAAQKQKQKLNNTVHSSSISGLPHLPNMMGQENQNSQFPNFVSGLAPPNFYNQDLVSLNRVMNQGMGMPFLNSQHAALSGPPLNWNKIGSQMLMQQQHPTPNAFHQQQLLQHQLQTHQQLMKCARDQQQLHAMRGMQFSSSGMGNPSITRPEAFMNNSEAFNGIGKAVSVSENSLKRKFSGEGESKT